MTKRELHEIVKQNGMYVSSGSIYYVDSSLLVCKYYLCAIDPSVCNVAVLDNFTNAATQETKIYFKTLGLLHGFEVGD